MKRTLIASALLAALAVPAAADVNFAINHFNQDKDSLSQVVPLVGADETITSVSTRNGALGQAVDIFNASQDSTSNRITAGSATVVSGTPAYGADIFAALRAADDDN